MRSVPKTGPCSHPSWRPVNDVNPVAYIAKTLTAIIAGHPQSEIDDLMPWRFRKTSSQHQ
ncbi:transposase domain-containing protein [Bradyrhizobium pachyrhizi]|uniref:transposase domain-containing protein n=1 Tax=Bradyrhizobium pachyrhizi TaxID=280333 RepID=UPI003D15FD7D